MILGQYCSDGTRDEVAEKNFKFTNNKISPFLKLFTRNFKQEFIQHFISHSSQAKYLKTNKWIGPDLIGNILIPQKILRTNLDQNRLHEFKP